MCSRKYISDSADYYCVLFAGVLPKAWKCVSFLMQVTAGCLALHFGRCSVTAKSHGSASMAPRYLSLIVHSISVVFASAFQISDNWSALIVIGFTTLFAIQIILTAAILTKYVVCFKSSPLLIITLSMCKYLLLYLPSPLLDSNALYRYHSLYSPTFCKLRFVILIQFNYYVFIYE